MYKILLIEDNPGDARLIKEILKEEPSDLFGFTTVDHLETGLRLVKEETFDAILLDLGLPDSQGLDSFIRLYAIMPSVPILVLSGYSDRTIAVKAVELGAQDYLPKESLDRGLLSQAILYAIQRKQIECSLKQERDFVNAILQTAASIIIVTDKDGRIVEINNAAEGTFGISKESVLGQPSSCLFKTPAEKAICIETFETLKSGKTPRSNEQLVKDKDGKIRHILWKDTTIRDGRGQLQYIISTGIDNTEQLAKEEEIRKLSSAVSQMPVMVLLSDPEGKIEYANPRFYEFTGYTAKDIIGVTTRDVMGEVLDPSQEAAILKAVGNEQQWRGELLNHKRNGELYWELAVVSPIRNLQNQITYLLHVKQDINDLKRIQEELASIRDHLQEEVALKTRDVLIAKRRIEQIINTITAGVLVLDPEGKLVLANEPFEMFFESTVGEKLSPGFNFLSRSGTPFWDTITRMFLGEMREKIVIETKPGVYLEITDREQGRGEDPTVGGIIEVRDVTDVVEFKKIRERFISTVSHELRTPISVIIQALENIRRYENTLPVERRRQLMEGLWRNALVMSDLVEDLLVISRMESKTLELHVKDFNLSDLLKEVLEQLESRREAKRITIDFHPQDGGALIEGDPKRIAQVFRVLVDNAIKYSPEDSTITLNLTHNYSGVYNPGEQKGILVSVADQGIGISKKALANLFTRFYRAEEVRDIPGTGLGLSIAKDLVNLHRGEIYVESEQGVGSKFNVFLPEKLPDHT